MPQIKLDKTPLEMFHKEHGATMVEFAGYSMPLQYQLGIKGEHLHTRSKSGLFDVSHICLLYTSPSPRDAHESRMPSSA